MRVTERLVTASVVIVRVSGRLVERAMGFVRLSDGPVRLPACRVRLSAAFVHLSEALVGLSGRFVPRSARVVRPSERLVRWYLGVVLLFVLRALSANRFVSGSFSTRY